MSSVSTDALVKTLAALILFSIALVGGMLPRRIQNVGSKVVSCLNTAAGGVFFATAMVHMLPESVETLYDAWGDLVPWGFLICSFGFLLILVIDQAVSIYSGTGHTGHSSSHSHEPGVEKDGVLIRLALLVALSVHSLLEGLGVGATTNPYGLLFAIGVHKGLAAYALGASLIKSGVPDKQFTAYVIAFAAMTPLGILVGAVIEDGGEDNSAGAVSVALAAGTFLYISLMEVISPELASTEHGLTKTGSLLAGFSVAAVVGWFVG